MIVWNLMVLALAIFGQDTPTPPAADIPSASFWTSTQFLGLLGVIVTVGGSFAVAVRTSKSSPGSSANVKDMWGRLDTVEKEVDDLKKKVRDWQLHHFRVEQWDITGRIGPMPQPEPDMLEV